MILSALKDMLSGLHTKSWEQIIQINIARVAQW